jgi:hypothetical protein
LTARRAGHVTREAGHDVLMLVEAVDAIVKGAGLN